ncbi:hypothetical protein ACFVVX_02955 [Kitasatospora sp. NPDC058170]|uniref:hypothetical protein n=1 Tax=Kitasatospora sp. NPDC058170 TaxID=3346364 RepID=UPI0036D991DE
MSGEARNEGDPIREAVEGLRYGGLDLHQNMAWYSVWMTLRKFETFDEVRDWVVEKSGGLRLTWQTTIGDSLKADAAEVPDSPEGIEGDGGEKVIACGTVNGDSYTHALKGDMRTVCPRGLAVDIADGPVTCPDCLFLLSDEEGP